MAFDNEKIMLELSKDEEKLILSRRKAEQQKKAFDEEQERKLELDSKPPTELTHEQLIQRLRQKETENQKLEAQIFIERAEARIIHHNKSGDWSWDHRDKPYIHQMYRVAGKQIPYSDW